MNRQNQKSTEQKTRGRDFQNLSGDSFCPSSYMSKSKGVNKMKNYSVMFSIKELKEMLKEAENKCKRMYDHNSDLFEERFYLELDKKDVQGKFVRLILAK